MIFVSGPVCREKRKIPYFSFFPNVAEIGYIYSFPFRFSLKLFGKKYRQLTHEERAETGPFFMPRSCPPRGVLKIIIKFPK